MEQQGLVRVDLWNDLVLLEPSEKYSVAHRVIAALEIKAMDGAVGPACANCLELSCNIPATALDQI